MSLFLLLNSFQLLYSQQQKWKNKMTKTKWSHIVFAIDHEAQYLLECSLQTIQQTVKSNKALSCVFLLQQCMEPAKRRWLITVLQIGSGQRSGSILIMYVSAWQPCLMQPLFCFIHKHNKAVRKAVLSDQQVIKVGFSAKDGTHMTGTGTVERQS